jgi:hypothetical protein
VSGPADEGHARTDRFEIVEVVILALVAMATAWSGHQATQWGGRQATFYGQASTTRFAADTSSGLIPLPELVVWSLDTRSPVVYEAGPTSRRVMDLVVLTIGSLVLGSLIVRAGRLGSGRGFLPTMIGVVGSIGVLVIVAWLSVVRANRQLTTR